MVYTKVSDGEMIAKLQFYYNVPNNSTKIYMTLLEFLKFS